MPVELNQSVSVEALSRYIDRFLFADGWRITDVSRTGGKYAVTLTNTTASGQSVTHSAVSAGEATFKACGLARKLRPGGGV